MKRLMALAVVAGLSMPAMAWAQADIVTTGSLLQGCRALAENDPNGNAMQIGACAGAVAATMDIARSQRRACPPAGSGVAEAARIVVNFANENAARRAEPFGPMALTALADRWRC